ncbi:MAG: VanZ family protein [Vicinamibacterales bacterium]
MTRPFLRFLLPTAVAAALVLSAPFVGQIRSAVRREFPGQYLLILAGAAAIGLAVALAAAVWRISDRKAQRYGAIALAILIAATYSLAMATEFPERNAVERFHFLQYGLITFLFYRAWRPLGDVSILVLPVLAGLIVGSVEEWFQWFIPNRVGEMNDVFLNLVAIVTGLLFSLGVDPPPRLAALAPGSRRRIVRLAIAALLTFAAFFHVVHLGSNVTDDEIGTFTSRFNAERLLALQAGRAATWASAPPPTTLVRLSREDQYLSEGLEHVQARNELWTAGDVRGAWFENRILEKYYAPVLDTPTHAGPGHRWDAVQRLDAEQRAGGPGGFVSEAYPYRLYAWPPLVFWTGVLLLIAAIRVAGRTLSGTDTPQLRAD